MFDTRALTIGFARRFATYKRADLFFRLLDELADLVNDPQRPVQLIFSGKAHPADARNIWPSQDAIFGRHMSAGGSSSTRFLEDCSGA